MSRSSLINWIVLIAVLAAAWYIVRTRRPTTIGSSAAIGKPLSALEVAPLTMKGDNLTLDDLRGKIALINYWGTWCPPCIDEFPHLAELEKRYHDENRFRIVSVSCERGDESAKELKEATEAFLADQDFGAGVYWDPDQQSRQMLVESAQMEDFGYPCTVIIDQEGKIAGLWLSYQDGVVLEMENTIRKLLK